LPVAGYEVLQVTFAFPLDLVADRDGGATCTIRLAGRFDFTDTHQHKFKLDAAEDRWEDLTAVLCLRHDRLKSVRASQTGDLVIEFDSGCHIEAGPSDHYENWQVTGLGFMLIASPGGGVFVFPNGSTTPGT
jgi:hypothetical protein